MWARIERDEVQELTDIDPDGRFHPDVIWVKCPKSCSVGMEYASGKFSQKQPEKAPDITREEVEFARLRAYSNPLTGSDRYFSESQRMKAMGEDGWEAVRDAGVSRFEEIQLLYPWP